MIPRTDERSSNDTLRQTLNVVGAVGQVAVGFVAADVGAISDSFRNPIVPAGVAFSIWGLIFLLLGVYAVVQALPNQATNHLFRSIGWWTAAAMIGNTVWTWVFTSRGFVLAQSIIFAIAAVAVVALVNYADVLQVRLPTAFERWVVGPAVGLLAGWITAAAFVGLAGTLIARGWDNDGTGAFLGGAGLLLFGGGVAAGVLTRVYNGPATAWVAYGAAVIWALSWIVANQADRSVLVAAVAAAIAVVVVALLLLAARAARRENTPVAAVA